MGTSHQIETRNKEIDVTQEKDMLYAIILFHLHEVSRAYKVRK
jgi:hypothetical protein